MPVRATQQELCREIRRLKEERKAVILAHVYQRPEIQEIADFTGDSLGLAQKAAATEAKVIVFCGVHFMAESASILCPDKTVILPRLDAGCPLADMAGAGDVKRKKEEIDGAIVVCYVNTTAAVKAESDIACTSANAVEVVASLPKDRPVIFVPDRNLGRYAAQKTGREVILWEGFCPVHEGLSAQEVAAAKSAHPQALVLVHPECRPEVVALADHVASTTGMIRFAAQSSAREFIICTEEGILYPLKKRCPEKEFYLASKRLVCPTMKLTTLEDVHRALVDLEPRVAVPPAVRERAVRCLERMLHLKGGSQQGNVQ